MRTALTLHPDSRSEAVAGIEVSVSRPEHGLLLLRYIVTANMSDLRLPPVTSPERTDGLWRHTCFEAFIRPSIDAAYYEFNFAPSTQWAAYRFASYRDGMSPAEEMIPPHIEMTIGNDIFELRAGLELDLLPNLPADRSWWLGLSAVIEETDGNRSYWAPAHPPGKPDFHHSDCFAMELVPA